MQFDLLGAFYSFLGSLVAASLVFFAVTRQIKTRQTTEQDADGDSLNILVRDGQIVDASKSLTSFADLTQWPMSTWDDLGDFLAWRFSNWPEKPPDKALKLTSDFAGDRATLSLTPTEDAIRLALLDPEGCASSRHCLQFVTAQAARFRSAMDLCPDPTWEIDEQSNRTWENRAYRELELSLSDTAVLDAFAVAADVLLEGGTERRAIERNGVKLWFDITARRYGKTTLHHAHDVTVEVAAESARLSFVQTLAKTFAHLSTGLAVFDRARQLVLFNPALVDLTDLSVEFLSSRPDLASFFDRLRDQHKVPEPKNYNAWRDKIAKLVDAASQSGYVETWTLSEGVTFRVTGRPHPEGAVAFLFDDISDEVLQTRRFRAQLDLGQSAFDALPDAVVLFSSTGDLVFSNASFRRLWDHDPEATLAEVGIETTLKTLADKCRPTPVWDRILEAVGNGDRKLHWRGPIQHLNGDRLVCELTPLDQGNMMLRFVKGALEDTVPSIAHRFEA